MLVGGRQRWSLVLVEGGRMSQELVVKGRRSGKLVGASCWRCWSKEVVAGGVGWGCSLVPVVGSCRRSLEVEPSFWLKEVAGGGVRKW